MKHTRYKLLVSELWRGRLADLDRARLAVFRLLTVILHS